MHKLLNILANVWSVVLYPMLMPLYGMLLFCFAIRQITPAMPGLYLVICSVGTTVLTLVIPIVLLLFMRWRGYIDSLHIDEPKQRTMPYIYTLICYGFWAYFMHGTVRLPLFMVVGALGAIAALAAVTVINHWWKISAHLTGIGGLLGGVCSFAMHYGTLPMGVIMGLIVMSLLLMYARIYLNAQTPLQVVCGFILGLLATFVPNLIMNHA